MHSDEHALERLRDFLKRERFDLLIFCGDITTGGPLSYAEDFLELMKASELRAVGVFGNMDDESVRELLEKRGVSLHGRRIEVSGFGLVGFGGSPVGPFSTPTEFSEEEIYEALGGLKIDENTVLVTHAPPYNTGMDLTRSGVAAGSKSIRRIIEERQPLVNVCGHIHEQEGEARLGRTVIVKVAPASRLRAAVLELGKEARASFISF